MRTADGSVITVAVFHGRLRYVLHNGSQDPGPAAAALVQAGSVVTGAERQQLLAAFNGGFKLRSRAGGYEQEGHVIRGLRHGLASLVIDRSGQARIGVWGTSVPVPGEAVYDVLQNLWPLCCIGVATKLRIGVMLLSSSSPSVSSKPASSARRMRSSSQRRSSGHAARSSSGET